jgi:hypothetical protein
LIRREVLTTFKGLDSRPSPYSKSHSRRLKRRAKEEVAGGFDELQDVITSLEHHPPALTVGKSTGLAEDVPEVNSEQKKQKVKSKAGQIGESKSAPLTKKQRKRAL